MRCLIIGCGCRGLSLAGALREAGHVVRGTTRDPARESVLAAGEVEPFLADPDRVGTLVPALQHVGVVMILLGSATGSADHVAALHGPRLEMLLTKLIDTTVRGLVYEAAGSVPAPILSRGGELVRTAAERSRIPYELLERDPADNGVWLESAIDAVARLSLES